MVMPKTTRFDATDYLDSEERQVAYIAAALESGDADFVRDALGLVARARGMGGIAKKAGLNRESLYKALGEAGNPEFGTVMRIVRALGLTRISHTVRRIGAPNQRKFFCEKDFAMIRGAPRCRQSVAQSSLILEEWKAAWWKRPLMLDW
jgi:probable addiction module antidote protein